MTEVKEPWIVKIVGDKLSVSLVDFLKMEIQRMEKENAILKDNLKNTVAKNVKLQVELRLLKDLEQKVENKGTESMLVVNERIDNLNDLRMSYARELGPSLGLEPSQMDAATLNNWLQMRMLHAQITILNEEVRDMFIPFRDTNRL